MIYQIYTEVFKATLNAKIDPSWRAKKGNSLHLETAIQRGSYKWKRLSIQNLRTNSRRTRGLSRPCTNDAGEARCTKTRALGHTELTCQCSVGLHGACESNVVRHAVTSNLLCSHSSRHDRMICASVDPCFIHWNTVGDAGGLFS